MQSTLANHSKRPESPRWLLTHDRHEEAVKVIAALDGRGIEEQSVRSQAAVIVESIKASGHVAGKSTPMSALFTHGKTQHFRRMLLGLGSQMMQQLSGCNAVIYYFPKLFQVSHVLSLLKALGRTS